MEQTDIRQFGASIGIELMGFCDTAFEDSLREVLRERRVSQYLSGFEEQDEDKRLNVEALLPGCKTIISIALPYRTVEVDKENPHFSRISLGLDYHRVIKAKTDKIIDFLRVKYGATSIGMCDTNPLVERAIAIKAGIGFQGKNNNIITDMYGSYICLGEVLTTLYIDTDKAAVGSCGNCTACIKACPSGALEKAFCLNGKKCLSYITQKKEELSIDEMNNIGTTIYGCDCCQEVCPKNSDKKLSNIEEFQPLIWNYNIEGKEYLNMSNNEFKKTFGTTSSGWRGKQLLIRNMIVAMGNSGNRAYLSILEEFKLDKFKRYTDLAIKKLLESDK